MKKLIIAALLVVSMTGIAQERKGSENRPNRMEMEKFTPEQRNQLMLKKMTLELDLNAKQQEQMKSIIGEQTAKRESRMKEMKANKDTNSKLSSDERFTRKSQMLDEQIAMKAKMKTILSADQFEKWDAKKAKHNKQRPERMAHRMAHRMGAKKDMQK
jgi:hypothetical protein